MTVLPVAFMNPHFPLICTGGGESVAEITGPFIAERNPALSGTGYITDIILK